MTKFLDLEDLLAAGYAVMGESLQVRDFGVLEAAAGRVRTTIYGVDAYPGLHEKAAALLTSLVRGHALIDGNERLGFVATLLFYDLNDVVIRVDHDRAYRLIMRIAEGELVDVAPVAAELRTWPHEKVT